MTTCTDADCFTAAADGAVTGTSVALEQPRLQAAAAAQLDQVRASRTRIVEACDTESSAGSSGTCTTVRSSAWSP